MEKEVSEVERKRSVKKKYTDKINTLLSKSTITQQELYVIVRGFFSELLKLEYEFTYEELSLDLNKIFLKSVLKKEINDFLYDLSESEYFLEKELESEQVRELILQFQDIVQSMIYDAEVQEYKPTFFEKLFRRDKSVAIPSETVPSSFDDGSAVVESVVKDSLPVMPIQSSSVSTTIEDREDVDAENELLKQKLFRNQGTTEINSNTQNENILLTFNETLEEKTDNLKTDIIKSGASYNVDSKLVEKKSKKLSESEKKTSKKSKTKDSISDSNIRGDDKSNYQDLGVSSSSSGMVINSNVKRTNDLLVEDNSPDMVGIHEFMEESYLYMNNSQIDDAKRSYLKALDIYHKLSFIDKKFVYTELYSLFKKLKPL